LASEAPAPKTPAKKASSIKRLFLKVKPASILLLLKDAEQSWYPSKLARTSGASYVHVVNLLAELRKYGFVTAERKGKQNIYRLTERGAYFALTLDDLVKKCESAEAEHKAGPRQEAPPAHAAPAAAAAKEEKPAEKK